MPSRSRTDPDPLLARAYERLANEEDARVCKDIADDACHYVPRNFFLIVGSKTLTQLGDALANPKTVLAWLMTFVGAPAHLLGLLVPIRESGSLIPQLVIAAWVRRAAVRKWVWVLGSLLQCAAVAGIGLSAGLRGARAGWAIVGCLAGFSLARGLCSVAHKDVLGKTIPKTRRGWVSGVAGGVAGVLVLAVGLGMTAMRQQDPGAGFYTTLLVGAGLLWLLAAGLFSRIEELPGETSGGGNALAEAFGRLALLRTDRAFRRFVLTRSMVLGSALVAPYYVLLGQRSAEGGVAMLGLYVIGGGLASSLSAPVWGKLADRSSRRTLLLAATAAGLVGVVVFAAVRTAGELPLWFHAVAFFALAVSHSGIRLGRKTYLVDMAGGNRRTDYVAVSNSVIGVVLLVAGAATASFPRAAPESIVLGLSLFALLGALLGRNLPEVED
jgi:hypothetical protein